VGFFGMVRYVVGRWCMEVFALLCGRCGGNWIGNWFV